MTRRNANLANWRADHRDRLWVRYILDGGNEWKYIKWLKFSKYWIDEWAILTFYGLFIQTWHFVARFSLCTCLGSFDVRGLSRLLRPSPLLSNLSICFVCVDLCSSSEISFLSRNSSLALLVLSLLSVGVHFFSLRVCRLLPQSSVYRLRCCLFSLFPWCLLCLCSFSGASRGILLLESCWITC